MRIGINTGKKLVLAFLILLSGKLQAGITLPKILGHNMVLQQNKKLPIWGYASPGEHVTVSFKNQNKETVADVAGKWMVELDPMKASSTPAIMTISGSDTITLNNILVGEVWLCSGQSNMEFTMRKYSKVVKIDSIKETAEDELKSADNPDIRIFLVTSKNLLKPDSANTGWSIAKDSALRIFSAPAYFFAKNLYQTLHVPVAVISSAIPGSAIEPWMDGTITNESELKSDEPKLKIDETIPGKFVPKMIQPIVPFAIKGFLWYQGENNCFKNENIEYTYKMQALINEWRSLWNDDSLPFYYVQIAPFHYSKSAGTYPLTKETLPKFWEAQKLAMNIPFTGMAVTTDLIKSPDDLHPGYKWSVGKRLSLWALAKTYGINITPSGPMYKQMKIKKGKIELEFDYTGSGLMSNDGKPLSKFEIAGTDGVYLPANAVIEGNKVIVSSPAITKPVNVRFEWTEEGKANFYNKNGLPAVPFRTDPPYHFNNNSIVVIKQKSG